MSYRDRQGGFFGRFRTGTTVPKLSQRIVSSSEGFHRFDLHGEKARFLLNAARDDVFDDGHHEMSDVTLEIYGAVGIAQGQVKAAFAVYDPSRSAVTFEQGVEASTSDGLRLKTDRLTYDGGLQMIRTDAPVEFTRANMSGFAVGAEISTRKGSEQVTLLDQVRMTIAPKAGDPAPPRLQPVLARCRRAAYRLDESIVHCSGEVVFNQSGEELSAGRMDAYFDSAHRLRKLSATEAAALVSRLEDRVADVRASRMEFDLDANQRLSRAIASEHARATRRGGGQEAELSAERIEVKFYSAGKSPEDLAPSQFTGEGGRVLVHLRSLGSPAPLRGSESRKPQAGVAPSEKVLTADSVELNYRENSRALEVARATGDAVLVLSPLIINPSSDRKTIRAQSMELRFYDGGNLARFFQAREGVRVEFEPMTPAGRSTRITTSQELQGEIDQQSQEFTELNQWGKFRYVEGDRNALSDRAVYSAATQVIRLIGGDPVVWDTTSRTRAGEIELNADTRETRATGNVLTTYYDRKATGQSMPFMDRGSPIFVAGENLLVNHRTGSAIYTVNARCWQEDSYVNGERIEVRRPERSMVATGHVRSAFYRSASDERTDGGATRRPAPPAYGTTRRLTYLDSDRIVRYEGEADLRQDTQRISADLITAYLERERAELDHAIAEGHVSVVEPGRKAFGETATYTAGTRTVVLRGRSARVEDDRNGVTRGPQLTFILGDGRVAAGDDRGSRPIKSTRKVE